MNILYVWSDIPAEYNSSWHRCHAPGHALRRAGERVEFVHNLECERKEPEAAAKVDRADLIIFQRNVFGASLGCIMDWVSSGKRVVIDLDDAYEFMDGATGSPTWKLWRLGLAEHDGKQYQFIPTALEQLRIGVSLTERVSSPSPVICEDWSKRAAAYYVPNYIDLRVYQRRPVLHKEPGAVYIGWGGSLGHMRAWQESGVVQALERIAREYKQVRYVVTGENALKRARIAPSRVIELPWRSYAQYPDFLSMLDIGLIPLAGEYDARRSCLKSLEYTAMGLPWVGSDVEPNRELVTGALVENTSGGWYRALKLYIDNLRAVTEIAVDKREEAHEWDLNNPVNTRWLMEKYREMAS